jgi:hypothetical protein
VKVYRAIEGESDLVSKLELTIHGCDSDQLGKALLQKELPGRANRTN